MNSKNLKVVSLIPSATEIVAALGLREQLVGRSHECDYPPEVQRLPVCTEPKFNPEGTSPEIHDRVTELLQSALSVYRIKLDALEQLQPTHILTQAQCEVCAVSLEDVEQAVGSLTHLQPQIISLQPNILAELWADIERVAATLEVDGQPLVAALKERVEACLQKTQSLPPSDRPSVVCIEWTDPLMTAGNWTPELVQMAGGKAVFGVAGQPSARLQWESLLMADPTVLVVMPCGYDLERTRQDMQILADHAEWQSLRAVRNNQVYLVDGNQYFNRPGPRLVESLEILAEILHPEQCRYGYEGTGWERWSPAS